MACLICCSILIQAPPVLACCADSAQISRTEVTEDTMQQPRRQTLNTKLDALFHPILCMFMTFLRFCHCLESTCNASDTT